MYFAIISDDAVRSHQHRRVVKLVAVSFDETDDCVGTRFAARFGDRLRRRTVKFLGERDRFFQRLECVAGQRAFRKDDQLASRSAAARIDDNDFVSIGFRITQHTIDLSARNVCLCSFRSSAG